MMNLTANMKSNSLSKYFLLVLLGLGIIWLRSSYSKFAAGNFAETLGGTLNKFASQNPYSWYKQFLLSVAVPNSSVFGSLVLWGELFAALSLILIPLYLLVNKNANRVLLLVLTLGLIVAAFLNVSFWLASSWTSPSTDSINLLMFIIEIVAIGWCLPQVMTRK